MQQHLAVIKQWQEMSEENTQIPWPIGPPQPVVWCIKMPLHPSSMAVSFNSLANSYSTVDFQDTLTNFITQTNLPEDSAITLRGLAMDTLIPFLSVLVYHNIKFQLYGHPNVVDMIHIWLEQKDLHGRRIPSHFDTVLVHGASQDGVHRNHGMFS